MSDSKYPFRLVVCLDVDASSVEEAYEKVYRIMNGLGSEKLEWESTDEAYNSDGEQIPEEEYQAARLHVFQKLRDSGEIE